MCKGSWGGGPLGGPPGPQPTPWSAWSATAYSILPQVELKTGNWGGVHSAAEHAVLLWQGLSDAGSKRFSRQNLTRVEALLHESASARK